MTSSLPQRPRIAAVFGMGGLVHAYPSPSVREVYLNKACAVSDRQPLDNQIDGGFRRTQSLHEKHAEIGPRRIRQHRYELQ